METLLCSVMNTYLKTDDLQFVFAPVSSVGIWSAHWVTWHITACCFLESSFFSFYFSFFLRVFSCLDLQVHDMLLPNCIFLQITVILKFKSYHCRIRSVFLQVIQSCRISLLYSISSLPESTVYCESRSWFTQTTVDLPLLCSQTLQLGHILIHTNKVHTQFASSQD
jgi:hypothetical protein